MLIEFKFSNFLSYKDEARLLMTTVKSFKEHRDTHIVKTNKNFELLKTATIYGKNGGGKSNFISAMGFMKKIIHNSFADSLKKEEDRGRRDYYFKLSEGTENSPSSFEVSFIIENDTLYRYGFQIKGYEIVKEWLFKKVDTETPLFERNVKDFKINSSSFPEGNKYKKDVNTNVLFLSHLAQNNTKVASVVFKWFRNLNVVSGLNDSHYKNVTKNLLSEVPEFKPWLSLAIRFLEISNIKTSKDKSIITYHNKFDQNDVIVDSVAFDFEREESQGTKKLIYLLGAVYDTLMFGKILVIDEIDSKLHPNLTKKLLELFHKLNIRNAQFIFTAHDSVLLDKDLFRRDQIWFVDRNKFGASELYSMSEFNASVVRNSSDFRKKYLDSVFGAAETLDITDELIKLM
ncbi:abortive infection protein [Galbibacter marinus]|uniref:Abortive infection protein n=1 Tax=Galbibacter marinus TaxID=555500 RepID=K2QKL7_9FLAO|nr:ATP-binding protein [Galbibacter marinus]EKF55237.1 abortive infection protein [Galbibacter marinus]